MLSLIKEIDEAKGKEKIEVLKNNPKLKPILKYAYDPFKKFYMTAPDLEGTFNGSGICSETKKLLDDLSTRQLSGTAAFEHVCDHIVSLNPNSAEIFKMILNKDLRCGISIKTINKAFPGLIPLVWDGSQKPPFALCKTANLKKIKYPCLAAVKKDGVRAQYIDKMISRQGKPLVGHNHIEDQLQYHVDGELCVPGKCFDEASGLIRSDDPTPNSVYWIFDVPGIHESKRIRYAWMKENIQESDSIKIIEHHYIQNQSQLMNFYSWAIRNGEEGIVIYDIDGEYEDRRIWQRMVPIDSADCEVIGFFEGKGKHAGSLGGIIINYKGHEVRVGTGFKEKVLKNQENQLVTEIDKNLLSLDNKKLNGYYIEGISPAWHNIRKFIWDNQDQFFGRIAKVEYKEKTKAGSLRQPRFKGWRYDK